MEASRRGNSDALIIKEVAAENHHSSTVLVRSPESDIFILLYYAAEVNATIILHTGNGSNRHVLDLSGLSTAYDQEYRRALLSLHEFTHCNTTSAFMHIVKVKPIKILEKFPHRNRRR